MSETAFKSQSIGLRVQKKILSRMATKQISKTFIDDINASLLDNLYNLCKLHTGDKITAGKLIKDIIKIFIKVGILYKNNQFTNEEQHYAEIFKKKFENTQLSIMSFYEVDYSFDLLYLQKSIAESHSALKMLVQNHLTEKSMKRIQDIFKFFSDAHFLEMVFKRNSPHNQIMKQIVNDLNAALEVTDK